MSPLLLIILLLVAQLLLSVTLILLAVHISRQGEGLESISAYESDYALEEEYEGPDTLILPKVDHSIWMNYPTFHMLPAWPPKHYDGPTLRAHAVKHPHMDTNIGYSQKGIRTH